MQEERNLLMAEEIICIVCPLGCLMDVECEGTEIITMKGHQCKQGKKHAQKEVQFPGRVLTTTVKTAFADFPLLPVRSNKEIPKDQLISCMVEIAKQKVSEPTDLGQPVVRDILGLGVDIIACRTVPCQPYECPVF